MTEKKVLVSAEVMKYFKIHPGILKLVLIPSFIGLFFNHISFAANPSPSQQMSGQERARQMQEEEENLQNQVEQPSTKAKTEAKADLPPLVVPTVMIERWPG